MRTLGEVLRGLREQAGLTQMELAQRVGTTQSVISRIENPAYSHYTFNTVDRVLGALGYQITLSERIVIPSPSARIEQEKR